MQENYVNMQVKYFVIQGTYAFSKLPIFLKTCFNIGHSFYLPESHHTDIMQHTYVGNQHFHVKIRDGDVNMQRSYFKI